MAVLYVLIASSSSSSSARRWPSLRRIQHPRAFENKRKSQWCCPDLRHVLGRLCLIALHADGACCARTRVSDGLIHEVDNIDYNGIKRRIKVNTTPGNGTAVSIPGTGDSVGKTFSNQLFAILNDEHDRLSLFVKSRWYEIRSRLS